MSTLETRENQFYILQSGKIKNSEAATETVFQNICYFFPGATFLQFSRRVYLFVEQTCFFPGGSIYSSNRQTFQEGVSN